MQGVYNIFILIFQKLFPFTTVDKKNIWLSSLGIIIANLILVLGIFLFKWQIYSILLIYWFESFIIGFFNIFKMLLSGAVNKESGKFSILGLIGTIFFVSFFTVHYGGFMVVHLIFILVFSVMFFKMNLNIDVDGKGLSEIISSFFDQVKNYVSACFSSPISLLQSELFAIIVIFVSHIITFYIHFIKDGEFLSTTPDKLMTHPYKRIIIMHLTIIIGAFAVFFLKSASVGFLSVFILLKIITDLQIHFKDTMKITNNNIKVET
jgi:hypothetical protein